MAAPAMIRVSAQNFMQITKIKMKSGQKISKGALVAIYKDKNSTVQRLKTNDNGVVKDIFVKEGDSVEAGFVLYSVEGCRHPTVMKDMCAECGEDLRVENSTAGDRKEQSSATVAMVHSIPELIVSEEQAKEIGQADEDRLLKTRKLVLLVDLDQTLVHTTNDNIPANLKDVNHFQLPHANQMLWYHTRLRPGTKTFLERISKLYELHICTFGVRLYAHTIATILDPKLSLFSHRILSRDECFSPQSKTANLKALFPCGDSMVCIIDDREDVWHFSPNLVHVKPYRFFQGTADINAPPGLSKTEDDSKPIVHRVRRVSQSSTGSFEEEHSGEKTTVGKGDDEKTVENSAKGVKEGTACEGGNPKTDEEMAMGDKSDGKTENGKKLDEEIKGEKTEDKEEKKENVKSNTTKGVEVNEGAGDEEIAMEVDSRKGERESDYKTVEDFDNKGTPIKADEIKTEDNKAGNGNEAKQDDKLDTEKKGKSNPELGDGEQSLDQDGNKVEKVKDGNKDENKPQDEKNEEELIEWDDGDDYLLYLEEILKTIHATFFEFHDHLNEKDKGDSLEIPKMEKPSLKNIIPYIKKKVLKGCNIVFSGIIPTNMSQEKSRAYLVARALGANIQQDLRHKGNETDRKNFTTHLVAAKQGTNKYRTALMMKHVKIVNADWLWCCSERWEKVEEMLFPLTEKQDDSGRDSPDPAKLKKDLKRKMGKGSNIRSSKRQKRSAGDKDKDGNGDDDDGDMKDDEQPSGSKDEKADKENKPGTFSMSYNPMFAFSDDDLAFMDKEVDDEMDENNDESSEDENSRDVRLRHQVLKTEEFKNLQVSESEDSLSGETPRGWGLKKMSPRHSSDDEISKSTSSPEKEELGPEYESETDQDKFDKIMDAFGPETENSDDEYQESIGSVDDEIADAVMKEFLS
ncbi:RNA polymerase II subunit A C-terminal domain phosphatase-like [Mya arenaria]|nr:RNA polymerase II subunit A C-terminal domain phosphatase-like [Mya arenaria]